MDISKINLKKITLTNNQLSYDGLPIQIKSNYYPAFIKQFGEDFVLSLRIPPSDPLHALLHYIDNLVLKSCPKDSQHIKLVRTFEDKTGTKHICANPKIKLAIIFNDKKEVITPHDVLKMGKINARFIGGFGKVKSTKKYFSVSLYGNQLMVQPQPQEIKPCMFD